MNNMISTMAFRNLKSRKSVFCIIGIAIILTSILFTTVISIGVSIGQSTEIARQAATGSNTHAMFWFYNDAGDYPHYSYEEKLEFLETVRAHPLVKDAFLITEVGVFSFKPDNVNNLNRIYACSDKGVLSHLLADMTEGRYPENETEILVEEHFRKGARVGDTIEVYEAASSEPVTFTICGFYNSFTDAPAKFIGLTSTSEELFAGDSGGSVLLKFASTVNIEGKMDKVSEDTDPALAFDINNAFLLAESGAFDPAIVISVLLVCLIVFFCGFLLIYNIYYISLQRDAKMFAMLKTLGTTKRQMKSLVFMQVNVIYLIFAPIGMFAGYLIGWISLSPLFMSLSGVSYEYEFDVNILIFTLLFTYLTTLLSALAPVGKIARLSCITAIKDTDSAPVKIKIKKSTGGAVPWRMAMSNMRREKKKNSVAIASVSLSIVTFIFMHMLVLVMARMTEFSPCDFTIDLPSSYGSNTYTVESYEEGETPEYTPPPKPEIPAELAERLRAIDGVKVVYEVKQAETKFTPTGDLLEQVKNDTSAVKKRFENIIDPEASIADADELFEQYGVSGFGEYVGRNVVPVTCVGLDNELFDMNTAPYIEGEYDSEKFASGKYAVISNYFSNATDDQAAYFHTGEIIDIDAFKNDYEVLCVSNTYWRAIRDFSSSSYVADAHSLNVYLPMSAFIEEFGDEGVRTISLNIMIDETQYDSVRAEIESVCEQYSVRDRRIAFAEYNARVNAMVVVGYTLAGIIFLIGIMNYINCIMCGVYARRHEFALLETVGMTNAQLKKMQLFEGAYFIAITSAISMGLGIPLLKKLLEILLYGEKVSVSMGVPLTMIAALTVIAALTITAAIHILNKQTMIERLKVSE